MKKVSNLLHKFLDAHFMRVFGGRVSNIHVLCESFERTLRAEGYAEGTCKQYVRSAAAFIEEVGIEKVSDADTREDLLAKSKYRQYRSAVRALSRLMFSANAESERQAAHKDLFEFLLGELLDSLGRTIEEYSPPSGLAAKNARAWHLLMALLWEVHDVLEVGKFHQDPLQNLGEAIRITALGGVIERCLKDNNQGELSGSELEEVQRYVRAALVQKV